MENELVYARVLFSDVMLRRSGRCAILHQKGLKNEAKEPKIVTNKADFRRTFAKMEKKIYFLFECLSS